MAGRLHGFPLIATGLPFKSGPTHLLLNRSIFGEYCIIEYLIFSIYMLKSISK